MFMKALLSILAASPLIAFAQTTHFVEVGGSSLGPVLPYYSPNVLTIQVGDIVTWTNVSGTHNVDGGTFFFPANPIGFGNGEPDNGTWSYSFTFTIPGIYNYTCNTEGHSATQTGRIIVQEPNSMVEEEAPPAMSLAPTPARERLFVEVGPRAIDHFEVLGLDGRMMSTHPGSRGRLATIPVHDLAIGNYILRIVEAGGRTTSLRFSKD